MHQSAVLHIITAAAEDKSKRGPFLMIERPKANISSNSFGHFEMRPLSQQLIVYFEETDEKNLPLVTIIPISTNCLIIL